MTRFVRSTAFALTAIVVSASLFGCGGTAANAFLGPTVNVSMTSADAFVQVDSVVPAGGRVVWTNMDINNHTVKSDTGTANLDSDVLFPAGLRPGNNFIWFVPAKATSGTK